MPSNETQYSFVHRVWIVTGIVIPAIFILLFLTTVFSVLLLVLAGALIAIFFHSLAGFIEQKTGWSSRVSLLISTIGTFMLIAGVLWLIGAKVQAQAADLSDKLPETITNIKSQLQSSPLGTKIVERLSSPESATKASSVARGLFSTTFGVLGDLYIIILLGLFFTISSKPYVEGFIQLIPQSGQRKATASIDTAANNLKQWLKGKLFAMLVVFVFTAIGLSIIGVPMWLTLALLAGLLNFIPNFGPLIAMIPAVLIASTQGINTALIVAGLYIVIQVVESNIITPSVQKQLIRIPPALIIIAQLVMGVLTGGWGLVLATPLVAILMAVVQEIYLKEKHIPAG